MKILRSTATAAAITVAGAGIAVGGIGLAAADDSTTGEASSSQTSTAAAGEGRGHGPGDRGRSGEQAAALAEALGLEESAVTAAMQAVRDELKPEAPAEGETRTPPTEEEREARAAEMASALADELGVSEQQVTDALESLGAERKAEARSALADRLDAAVADDSLTDADKESVLKAFDAGVLGGERHGRGGGTDGGAASS